MTAYELQDLFKNQMVIMKALVSILESSRTPGLTDRIAETKKRVEMIDQQMRMGRQ